MRTLSRRLGGAALLSAVTLLACKDPPNENAQPDLAAPVDALPPAARCALEPAPAAPAGVGTPIAAGEVAAGVGEAPLDLPVGTPMAGYTSRLSLLPGHDDPPDGRRSPHAKTFVPSAGKQTQPLARALYLKAGTEPVIVLKADLCLSFDRLVYDVEAALSAQGLMPARGRVIVAGSHTHAGPGTYHGAFHLALGADLFQEGQYQRLLGSFVTAAKAALASAAPARIGAGIWDGWDRNDEIYSDRRSEDDTFPGPDGKPVGKHKEQRLLVLRVDTRAGEPLAALTSFPMHGTIGGGDNPLFSVDAPGHVELALEEQFDSKVMVMHLQGPAGDASPRGRGGLAACDAKTTLCTNYARMEAVGELAAPRIAALFRAIKTEPQAALEVVTRTVRNGRDITVRGGMAYAPFDPTREIDGSPAAIYTPEGAVRSPITQFNVEAGAALCGSKNQTLPADGIAGAKGIPYGSCSELGSAAKFIARVLGLDEPSIPTCETTRTTLTALRLGGVPVLRRSLDMVGSPVDDQVGSDSLLLVTLPGEPVSLLADALRRKSPAGADKTFVVGYAQGHVGYILGVENWLLGGYEPSINIFGPLEGEWLMERALDLAKLAWTPERDDAEAGGENGGRFDRFVFTPGKTEAPQKSPATRAGEPATTIPATLYVRARGALPTQAQPPAEIKRVSGRATFVWNGGDPEDDAPVVTLERQVGTAFVPVTLRSGRALTTRGREILLTYTPDPIDAAPDKVGQHLWAAEWQAVGWDQAGGKVGTAAVLDVPPGAYRFSVRGTSDGKPYALQSAPFTVAAAGAIKATASRSGTRVTGQAVYPVGPGYRLLSLDGASDGDVPVTGAATVTLRSKKTAAEVTRAVTLTDGRFDVDLGTLDATAGIDVLVKDRASNDGLVTTP